MSQPASKAHGCIVCDLFSSLMIDLAELQKEQKVDEVISVFPSKRSSAGDFLLICSSSCFSFLLLDCCCHRCGSEFFNRTEVDVTCLDVVSNA